MSKLGQTLSQFWSKIQDTLFPYLEDEQDSLTKTQQQLITILELVRVERYVRNSFGCEGRPLKARAAIARSFVAKMLYNMNTTDALWERLQSDKNLRRICGFESKGHIPSQSSFSRAFAEFAESQMPQRVHEALIKNTLGDTETIVMHNSRDATAIEGREKPILKEQKESSKQASITKKRGRPKKGSETPLQEPTRIEKQQTMTLEEMLTDLPKHCNIGTKKNSKGHVEYWIGYKLHLDIADGCIPISAILTSASLHDSQVAIPLATITAQRVTNLYDLMDSAYDVPGIIEHSRSLGHVPLVDKNPRRNKALADELHAEEKRQTLINMKSPEKVRYNERSTAERANSRLKDDFGGRMIRVQGHAKVSCHLMFGLLALTADQLIKMAMNC